MTAEKVSAQVAEINERGLQEGFQGVFSTLEQVGVERFFLATGVFKGKNVRRIGAIVADNSTDERRVEVRNILKEQIDAFNKSLHGWEISQVSVVSETQHHTVVSNLKNRKWLTAKFLIADKDDIMTAKEEMVWWRKKELGIKVIVGAKATLPDKGVVELLETD